MNIPKVIHYCWFGHNPKPKLAQKCIRSWKKYCPDYEIKEWNESNFNIDDCPLYVRQAYVEKKWAFVSDYARLKIIHTFGGIYLDTDVELKKSLDSLLEYNAFFGFEDGVFVATGLGFGAIPQHQVINEMMRDYENIPFIKEDGSQDLLPCPQRNTDVLLKYGLIQDDSLQILEGNIIILPSIFLCPLVYESRKLRRSKDTIAIHWFTSYWLTDLQLLGREKNAKAIRKANMIHNITHIPNRVLRNLLGNEKYEKLKTFAQNII